MLYQNQYPTVDLNGLKIQQCLLKSLSRITTSKIQDSEIEHTLLGDV